ncbi:MAG: nitrous oxide reductase accessory protein NosL [Candidatus Omnitrophica bacterium]|nr:nitrous oxide reductase accessory protein NosL [Candidatus Omnitrophota bacterium]
MRGLKIWAVLVFCLGAAALAGCGKTDLSRPPKIFYGRDVCARCRMIIEDQRFACAAVSADGRFQKFDDIGCLAAYKNSSEERALRSWVRDAGADVWIGTEEAHFVHSRDLATPMGYGLAAFAAGENARRFAKEKTGRVLHWNEWLDLTKEEAK